MKLLCIPVGEDGLPKAFMVSRVATMTKLPSSKEGDRKNIFATTVVDSCPATTLPSARTRSCAKQAIDSK